MPRRKCYRGRRDHCSKQWERQRCRSNGRDTACCSTRGRVATLKDCRSVVDAAVAAMRELKVLVHSAGICFRTHLMELTEEH
jgi:NAD(P)-dependent dehydrogenase (short-subunit alcohol dehydrogenase family)